MSGSLDEAVIRQLVARYEDYKEPALTRRRFKHHDLVPLLEKLGAHPAVTLTREGESAEGRGLFRLSIGTGDIPVLMWSQMHGDEATATLALLDLFRFLTADGMGADLSGLQTGILQQITLHAIPMLNPDAAERFQRHTPYGVDMNRDAVQRQCPESRLLKRIRDELQAEYGFNLHDQSTRYSVGESPKSAIISFLAPPFDAQRTIDPKRERSMQLIAGVNGMLQQVIPGHVAAYSDEFEPRAFGDNMQKWGTSTVLVESGGKKDDPEKQFIRKINGLILITSLHLIASETFQKWDVADYEAIPPNKLRLFDTVFRGASLRYKEEEVRMDIGINRTEINTDDAAGYYIHGIVAESGDLSTFNGYEEIDAGGLRVVPGEVFPELFETVEGLQAADPQKLLQQGYTAIRVRHLPEKTHTDLPYNIVSIGGTQPAGTFPDSDANLLFYRDDHLIYAVINGFVIDILNGWQWAGNSLVYY